MTSAYETDRSNSSTGADITVVAHQSYKNDSFNAYFENLSESGDFTVPCPEDTSFNSSRTFIKVNDINAPNKTLVIETGTSLLQDFHNYQHAFSFEVAGDGILDNFSIVFTETNIAQSYDAQIDIELWGAKWYGSPYNEWGPDPENVITSIATGFTISDNITRTQYNFTNINEPLYTSQTENNMYFIFLYQTTISSRATAQFACELDGTNDESKTWYDSSGAGDWQPTANAIDPAVTFHLLPLTNNTPSPEDIKMKINITTEVFNITNGGSNNGTLTLTNQGFTDLDGYLDFEITADWWEVSCTITEVQVNYTKTDLATTTAFIVPGSGEEVMWNVTVNSPGIWGFDSDTSDWNYVNFTIPDTWNEYGVYNGESPKTASTFDLPGGTKIITALNADDGTFWYLNATSENLLRQGYGILSEVGSINLDVLNFTDEVTFTANFTTSVQSPNNVNLTVYSPSSYQNYTISSPASGSQVSCGTWDISTTATEYGMFVIQAFWNNATHCGFVEKTITILGMTELALLEPGELYYFKDADPFNITFSLNDSSGPESPYFGLINANSYTYLNITGSNSGSLSSNTTGYYYLEINPLNYNYGSNDFDFEFKIAKYNNQTYSFTFYIINATEIIDGNPSRSFSTINYNSTTFEFFYNDTISDVGIENADFSWEVEDPNFEGDNSSLGGGYYLLNIFVNEVSARVESYWVNITVSKEGLQPHVISLSFTISLIDITSQFLWNASENYYKYTYLDYSARISINRTDTGAPIANSLDVMVTHDGNLWPDSVSLTSEGGGQYVLNVSIAHSSIISGNYSIMVNISKSGVYGWTMINLNFTLIGNNSHVENFSLSVGSTVLSPISGLYNATKGNTLLYSLRIYDENGSKYVTSGQNLLVQVTYSSGTLSASIGFSGEGVTGTISTDTLPKEGNYTITITIRLNNYEPIIYEFDIEISNPLGGGPDLGPIIFILMIILAGIIGAVVVVTVNKKVFKPKKIAKRKVLTEVESVFDDAVNLEHVLVLYKNTGMCVFFKSFGLEEIDPELISGFLSAVSSFGKEMESTQALNEIRYGDKQILLTDGQYIRVALVLGKKPSMVTRKHLSEFIVAFEKYYQKALSDWRGNLKAFQGADRLVDSMLNTSIILPHEIKFNLKAAKTLKSPNSKEVLRITQNLVKESERQYFFIGQLLALAVEKLKKEKAEVFMGIKELRDRNLIVPIEVTAVEAPPISQQEIDLIHQRVSGFTSLSDTERQKLVNDIAAIRNPVEREAYITSISEHQEIVSKPVASKGDIGDIKDAKTAKKAIDRIRKNAQSSKKKKEYKEAIEILNGAAEIADTWALQKVYEAVKDDIRVIDILHNKGKLRHFEEQAERAIKTVKYKEAADFYNLAAKTASNIFKLGDSSMDEKVKYFTNKAKECEKKFK